MSPRGGPKTRSHRRYRTVAECATCHKVKPGVTTVEHLPWGNSRRLGKPDHRYHFCDDCRASVVERPIEAVLVEAAGEETS